MHLINTCREQHLRKYISISYLNIKEEMWYAYFNFDIKHSFKSFYGDGKFQ